MAKETFLNLPEQKREQIQAIAEEEFARASFSQASLSKIVERAGIAKGSIYQYFENKLGLYRWITEQAAKKKLSYMKTPMPSPGHFLDWYEEALLAGLHFAIDHPRLARIALQMTEGNDPKLAPIARKLERAGLEYIEKLVREAQQHGELREDLDPKMIALLARSVQENILRSLCTTAGVNDLSELVSGLKDVNDAELTRMVHSWMELLRNGAAASGPLHPVEGLSTPLEVDAIIDEAFD